MRIPTIEDNFDYQFKELIKDMKDLYPELKDLSSEDLQDAIWKDIDMCKTLAHKMIEKAFEYGGDKIFETDDEDD